MPRSFSRGLKPPRYITVTVLAASLSVAGSAQQNIQTAPLSLVPVQGNVHLLVGAGPNIAVQVGGDGIVLVDTPRPALSAQVQEQLRTLSRLPVRYILNTSMDPEHVSGNAAFVPASGRGTGGAPFGALGLARPAIIAHEAVLNRLSSAPAGQPAVPATALPTTTYHLPSMDFHVNGEPVFLYHQANAHTDGDSLILFRNSNVVATGDLYTPDRYPLIDLQRGGSVQGIITALNRILTLTVPAAFQEGGTVVIPGHGRLSEEADVVEYRDMVAIVRDRVQDLIKKGQSLEQVKAARPSRDYDSEYGNADAFIEAVYRSLAKKS
jgi:cyclase